MSALDETAANRADVTCVAGRSAESRKSVCILLFFDAYCGGAELHTLQLAGFLQQRGVKVTLVVKPQQRGDLERFLSRHGDLLQEPEIQDCRLDERMTWRQCGRLFREHPADVYVCPKGGFGSGSMVLECLAKMLGIPFVTIEHQTPGKWPSARRRWLPRMGFWQCKYRLCRWARSIGPSSIVAVSRTAQCRFVSEFWYPRSRTVAVPNGVDISRFAPNPSVRAQVRGGLHIADDAIVCGMVCRLVGAKAIDVALRAFEAAQLCETTSALHLVIFGDGPLSAELQSLSATLSSAGRIHWAGSTSEPWAVYPAFDYFLLSSSQEGLPLSLLEAMASGCVPVATPVGGVPDVVADGENGFLAPSMKAADYATTLVRALQTSVGQFAVLSQRSLETARRSFNLDVQMNRLCDVVLESTR